jgi:hypothetical protein
MFSVLGIWILGYSFALPVGIFSDVSSYPPLCGVFCDEAWPDTNDLGISKMRKTYGKLYLLTKSKLTFISRSPCSDYSIRTSHVDLLFVLLVNWKDN